MSQGIKYYIRPLYKISEFLRCEQIQKLVWGFKDREIIPVNELITIQRNGGIVLGAFAERNRMLGFVFGFPGLYNRKLIHCSRMLAVLPRYRNSDIGYKLKLAQRDFAIKQGINLITWTFDPLQSLNAYFNITKLGVIVRQYYINLYGTSSSILNKGLETDRFLAEWRFKKERRITSPTPVPRLNRGPGGESFWRTNDPESIRGTTMAEAVNWTYKKDGWLVCSKPRLNLKSKYLLVEIPPEINKLKAARPALARNWRQKTRTIFIHYFRRHYWVTGFISREEPDKSRKSFYLLERRGSYQSI